MGPRVALLALLLSLGACDGLTTPHPGGCGSPGALCALRFTLVVTGHVRANGSPVAAATVLLTAYQTSCSGAEVLMLPSPTGARTDSLGAYVALAEVTQAVSSACVRVTYADTLHADTTGVALHTSTPPADTLHLDIVSP